ncbi:S8 family serine peptidase, partial [Rhodococcus sp. 852002-51564_SCH6189132-a]|uniref:S8 family serine peptidase n=1 Tax=Rhodococcus sp. 852002-51564_SCH6189132-a TaxID=1834103 RepID=UPI002F9103AD
MRLSHRFAVLALAALIATTTPGLATAAPPVPDPAQLPAGATPAPPEATEMRVLCAELPDAPDGPQIPRAQRILDFASVWPITRGAGQVVAVIDTGVHPHPRLPAPRPGGDYVSTGDGTEDCDAHGTLVAGLIAARPTPGSGFAGGAPDVGIIAIRQSSGHFSDRSRSDDDAARNASGYGDVRTLAAAVRQAVDLGATVVNVSAVACR